MDVLSRLNFDSFYLAVIVTAAVLTAAAFLLILTATALRWKNVRMAARWAKAEERWRRPVLETLSGIRSPEDFQKLVDPSERRICVRFLMQFAQRVRGVDREILARIAEPWVDDLIASAHRGDPETRAQAVNVVSVLGGHRRRSTLLSALDDESPLVAMVAARGLVHAAADRRDAAAADGRAILSRIDRFDHWSKNFLASTLAAAGASIGPDLLKVMGDRNQPYWVRAVAIAALRRLRFARAVDEAVAIVRSEENSEVVVAALRLLAALRLPAALELVREKLRDPRPVVRAHAAAALGAMGSADDAELISPLLRDEVPWVAIQAAAAIGKLGADHLLVAAEGLLDRNFQS